MRIVKEGTHGGALAKVVSAKASQHVIEAGKHCFCECLLRSGRLLR